MKNFQPLIDDIQDSFTGASGHVTNLQYIYDSAGLPDSISYDFTVGCMAPGANVRELIKLADYYDFNFFIDVNHITNRLRIVFH